MKTTIERIESMHILYRTRIGAYGSENKKMMDAFKSWLSVKNLRDEKSVVVAVIYDDPSLVSADVCRYDVGLVVHEVSLMGSVKSLATGLYLVFEIDHTEKAIQECWEMFPNELLDLGYQINPVLPIIERYSEAKIRVHRCEICVPIQ